MISEFVSKAIVSVSEAVFGVGSEISLFVQNYSLLIFFVLFLLPLIVIGILFMLFDLLVDIWKLPFAVFIDVVKYLGFSNSKFNIMALILGPVVFLLLVYPKNRVLAVICSILSISWTLVCFFTSSQLLAGLIAIIPFNIALMTIACILD
ncbi:MAG: hypothetical protein ABIC91_04600 [Nanoarchaeota archaeon]|nr:hypothetical protein [Nanoarchaeota archaeon]MBU1031122.1 hypothetical protein [Nanoarchaeota archaeon]MBU1850710.1 hypothetical protein [Nanoarchaeota archaeon]